jgi:glycosyltransferase involved in cell wall biosynthesis
VTGTILSVDDALPLPPADEGAAWLLEATAAGLPLVGPAVLGGPEMARRGAELDDRAAAWRHWRPKLRRHEQALLLLGATPDPVAQAILAAEGGRPLA